MKNMWNVWGHQIRGIVPHDLYQQKIEAWTSLLAIVLLGTACEGMTVGEYSQEDLDTLQADRDRLATESNDTVEVDGDADSGDGETTRGGHYAYISSGNNVEFHEIDSSTGRLTFIEEYAAGVQTASVVATRDNKCLYVTSIVTHQLRSYSINQSNGELTLADTLGSLNSPAKLKEHPTLDVIYLPESGGNAVNTFSRDSDTCLLTLVQRYTLGFLNPYEISISSGGESAIVSNAGTGLVSTFSLNNTTGALTYVEVETSGQWGSSVKFHGNGLLAYSTNATDNLIVYHYYLKDSANATLLGAVASGGIFPHASTITGNFLIVSNLHSDTISVMSINTGTGALSQVAGSPFSLDLDGPGMHDFHPNGSYFYSVGQNDGEVSVYSFNSGTGALTQIENKDTNGASSAVDIEVIVIE